MGFDENLIIFIFIYIITIVIILIIIWYIFIVPGKSKSGEFCNDNNDCASGLICAGGNQCVDASNKLSGIDGQCINNSNCLVGLLCTDGTCQPPSNESVGLSLSSFRS